MSYWAVLWSGWLKTTIWKNPVHLIWRLECGSELLCVNNWVICKWHRQWLRPPPPPWRGFDGNRVVQEAVQQAFMTTRNSEGCVSKPFTRRSAVKKDPPGRFYISSIWSGCKDAAWSKMNILSGCLNSKMLWDTWSDMDRKTANVDVLIMWCWFKWSYLESQEAPQLSPSVWTVFMWAKLLPHKVASITNTAHLFWQYWLGPFLFVSFLIWNPNPAEQFNII